MSASSRSLDRFATTVDDEGLVADAGLILAGTLMARLGLSAPIERWVRTGSANPGPKICAVVAAMLAGATHIDHVGMLLVARADTVAVLGAWMRKGSAGSSRGVERFVGELELATLGRLHV